MKLWKFNLGPYHFLFLLSEEDASNLDDSLPKAHLFEIQTIDDYFVYIVYFLSTGLSPPKFTIVQKKQIVVKATDYQLIAGKLYKLGADGIL
jgi:hypothetical protein